MNNFFLLFSLSLFSFKVFSQDKKVFPENYFGKYKGELEIISQNGINSIKMEFHLFPTDTIGKYHYSLIYNDQERKYSLIEKNKTKGIYVIDENNGVLLDTIFLENTLYSIFEVNNSLLTTTLRFKKNIIEFEITYTLKEKATLTQERDGNEEIKVTSYPVKSIQRALLIKE